MSLLRAITGGNDVTLLCMAQDIVQEVGRRLEPTHLRLIQRKAALHFAELHRF